MKLTTAIAQFLYLHKKLDIPGIGTFTLDPSVVIADNEQGKQQKNPVIEGISFEYNPAAKESADLIPFLSAQTGKMKALASADLVSHLELMQQFLNIGKPFLLEGIGTLSKIKSGIYEFTPGFAVNEKLKDISSKSDNPVAATENAGAYEPFLKKDKPRTAWKKPVAVLLVLAGIGFAIWGGYNLYKKNQAKNEAAVAEKENTEATTQSPTAAGAVQPPPTTDTTTATKVPEGNHKFVLEVAGQQRAVDRFNKLKLFQWPVQMETKDSVEYTLYMLLPAADTTKTLDSLSRLNGKRVFIAK